MNTLRERYFRRGSDFLGTKYPIICGAMTWVSNPKLVSTVCNNGGLGCLAGGNTPPDILISQIEETKQLTDKPIGVNLITIAPLYKDHLNIVKKQKLPFIIFAGSFPKEKEIAMVKESGAKVLCFASTSSIAKRMIRYGADAIILEGSEAGGHVGHVSLAILLQQVLFEVDEVPIFVAGGLGTGIMCAHLFLMGASGVQLGTRFAVTHESCAHKKFKKRLINARAREAISTPQYNSKLPVVAVRALKNTGYDEFGNLQLQLLKQLEEGTINRSDAQIKVEEFWMGALRRAVIDGDIDNGSLMAGQSVGLVNNSQSINEVIQELVEEIEIELGRVRDSII